MSHKKVPIWEWIVSILISSLSAVIIWTNESIDLFSKLGINISPGIAIIIFGTLFMFGLSWILTIFLRRHKII